MRGPSAPTANTSSSQSGVGTMLVSLILNTVDEKSAIAVELSINFDSRFTSDVLSWWINDASATLPQMPRHDFGLPGYAGSMDIIIPGPRKTFFAGLIA